MAQNENYLAKREKYSRVVDLSQGFLTKKNFSYGATTNKNTRRNLRFKIGHTVPTKEQYRNTRRRGQRNIKPDDNDPQRTYLQAIAGHESTNAVTNVMKELNKRNINFDIRNKNGISPLYIAILKGNTPVALELISRGSDVNVEVFPKSTPLYLACQLNNTVVALELLRAGANALYTTKDGSCLTFAVKNKNLLLAKKLLEAGAPVNFSGRNQSNIVLVTAFFDYNLEMIRLLLDFGANPDSKGMPFLYYLYENGGEIQEQIAEVLKLYGCNPNYSLSPAWKNNMNISIIERLISDGGDINYHLDYNFTLLFYAITEGTVEHVKRFVELNATVGYIEMEAVINKENIEMTNILLEHGGRPDIVDREGHPVILNLIEKSNSNEYCMTIFPRFLQMIDLTWRSRRRGFSYLHKAVGAGALWAVKLLCEAGADPTAMSDSWIEEEYNGYDNNEGSVEDVKHGPISVLDYAVQLQRTNIIQAIRECIANRQNRTINQTRRKTRR
jgi:ankyrin repeat protein